MFVLFDMLVKTTNLFHLEYIVRFQKAHRKSGSLQALCCQIYIFKTF